MGECNAVVPCSWKMLLNLESHIVLTSQRQCVEMGLWYTFGCNVEKLHCGTIVAYWCRWSCPVAEIQRISWCSEDFPTTAGCVKYLVMGEMRVVKMPGRFGYALNQSAFAIVRVRNGRF